MAPRARARFEGENLKGNSEKFKGRSPALNFIS